MQTRCFKCLTTCQNCPQLTNKISTHEEKFYDGVQIGMIGYSTEFHLGYYPENAATTDVIQRAIRFHRPTMNLTQICKNR